MYYGGVVKSGVHACLSRRRSRVRIPSSPPIGQIAQSVEHLKTRGRQFDSASGHKVFKQIKDFCHKNCHKTTLDRHL